jgi:hypothetical protein
MDKSLYDHSSLWSQFGIDPWFGSVILGIGIFVGIFLLMRQVMLWYWRINEVVDVAKKIEGHLGDIARSLSNSSTIKKGPVEEVITRLQKEQPY